MTTCGECSNTWNAAGTNFGLALKGSFASSWAQVSTVEIQSQRRGEVQTNTQVLEKVHSETVTAGLSTELILWQEEPDGKFTLRQAIKKQNAIKHRQKRLGK